MSRETEVDGDVLRAAMAIKTIRERLKISQRKAAEAHPAGISHQYWAMHEQGKVPGIVKPQTQRDLLTALTLAAALERPLTLEDLVSAMDEQGGEDDADARARRMAASLRPSASERRAVFPTSDGDVIFTFPAEMTAEGFRELEAYFQVFAKANAPKA